MLVEKNMVRLCIIYKTNSLKKIKVFFLYEQLILSLKITFWCVFLCNIYQNKDTHQHDVMLYNIL